MRMQVYLTLRSSENFRHSLMNSLTWPKIPGTKRENGNFFGNGACSETVHPVSSSQHKGSSSSPVPMLHPGKGRWPAQPGTLPPQTLQWGGTSHHQRCCGKSGHSASSESHCSALESREEGYAQGPHGSHSSEKRCPVTNVPKQRAVVLTRKVSPNSRMSFFTSSIRPASVQYAYAKEIRYYFLKALHGIFQKSHLQSASAVQQ